MLQLLWKENDLYGDDLQQQIGSGRFDLDVNQTGRVYWHTDIIGNLYRSAQNNGPFTPWTKNYLFRNQFRHRYSELGFWDLRADLRVVRVDTEPVEDVITGNASANLVAPLSPRPFRGGGRLPQQRVRRRLATGSAAGGSRTEVGQAYGRWWWSLYPRVSYVTVDAADLEQESASAR